MLFDHEMWSYQITERKCGSCSDPEAIEIAHLEVHVDILRKPLEQSTKINTSIVFHNDSRGMHLLGTVVRVIIITILISSYQCNHKKANRTKGNRDNKNKGNAIQ